MKNLCVGLIAVLGAALSPGAMSSAAAQTVTNLSCAAAPSGQGVGQICTAKMTTGDGANERDFRYYVPNGLAVNKPMVMVFHGGKTDSIRMMSEGGYAWNKRADTKGFIAVFPDGKPETPTETGTRNWNDCRAVWSTAGDGGISPTDSSYTTWDDVKFADNLLNWFASRTGSAATNYKPDMTKVYATGPSNGGMLTQRLARESIASRFKGFASSIANLPAKDKCPATPASPPAANSQRNMLLTFGVLDEIMPYNGGCLAAPFVSANCDKGRMKSAAQTIAAFSGWYGAANKTDQAIADGTPSDGQGTFLSGACTTASTQTQSNYRPGNATTPIKLSVVTVSRGGHTQPGAVGDPQIDATTRVGYRLGCRNLDRSAVTYITDFWQI
jgi:poly(3-hydroxybutyrate) depolymerase